MGIAETVRDAGIVGAGGAGFPSHVKLQAKVDTVIANGAECEPLLRCDKAMMLDRPQEILEGLALVQQATGARRAVLALKGHYAEVVESVRRALGSFPNVEMHLLDNYYPSGDEHQIVHEVTGRIVPEGGIPLAVGCVVSNVVTLWQIARAVHHGEPVTSRPLTVLGDVNRPRTLVVPVGTTTGEALALAGGATVEEVAFIDGGPMMGQIHYDPERPITKRSSGLLVLSATHDLARRKSIESRQEIRLARDVCCQCRFCTDLCPRYLLGHALHPHLVMRSVKFTNFVDSPDHHLTSAFLCCQCGICEVVCPLHLSPRRVYADVRAMLARAGVKNPHDRQPETERDGREYRFLPVERLISRLGLDAYAHQGWDVDLAVQPVSRVRIPLSQHTGAPALPVVRVGDSVRTGDLVGEIPEGKLGARVHASIDGIVTRADGGIVEIRRSEA